MPWVLSWDDTEGELPGYPTPAAGDAAVLARRSRPDGSNRNALSGPRAPATYTLLFQSAGAENTTPGVSASMSPTSPMVICCQALASPKPPRQSRLMTYRLPSLPPAIAT